MNSESNTKNRMRGIILDIPSILSNNKMLISGIAFLYLLPLGTTASTSPIRAFLFLITQIMIFGLLAMSFDLQLGRAGLLNFGHVALFGVGAYTMAFTLDAAVLPFPLALVLAILISAGLGFVMGLTTSRMRGTAFAFIALAIAMFLFNFFKVNPDISGGETGLRVGTPDIIRTAPFYLMFVTLAFVFLAAFMGMVILYLKKRRESIGLILFTPIMIAFTGVLIIFGTNIIGPALVFIAFLGMMILYLMESNQSTSDPLEFSEKIQTSSAEGKPTNMLTTYILPISIVIIALIGLAVTFGSNIIEMVLLGIEQTNTYYFTIPVQYYLVLTSVVIVYVFTKRLMSSPFGRMVTAVAQNEERAEALGYNSYRSKIVVMIIAGAIAGLSGALYAPFIRTIDPITTLGVEISIDAMLYTIIGGLGTLFGPLLGAGVIVYSELNLVDFIQDGLGLPGELWLVGLGMIYIAIVLFMPLGIVGSLQNKSLALKQKLQRLKIGRFEFGIKDADYWVFGLLGAIGLILLMLILSL